MYSHLYTDVQTCLVFSITSLKCMLQMKVKWGSSKADLKAAQIIVVAAMLHLK